MTRVGVRPLTDGDDVDALDEGDPLAWMTAWWRSIPELPFRWFVGLLDGEPVGVAAGCPRLMAAGGTGFALLNVVPSARRRGVGTELRRVLEDSVRGLVPGLVYSYLEGDPTAEAAVRAWGLTEMGRHHQSVLDLTAVDRDMLRRKAALDGVNLAPLGAFEEMTDADWASTTASCRPVSARPRTPPTGVATCRSTSSAAGSMSPGCSTLPAPTVPSSDHVRDRPARARRRHQHLLHRCAPRRPRPRDRHGAQGRAGARLRRSRRPGDLHTEHGRQRADPRRQPQPGVPARLRVRRGAGHDDLAR